MSDEPYYIAVSEYGCGVHQVAAMAIRLAQIKVPADAEESQMLIYRSQQHVEAIGWKHGPIWPNGVSPQLAGLIGTHQGFKQKPRL
jgi:hypothetical protein